MSADFDVFGCELDGTRLIEASAGTGKTWNLCGIYLRLLLERGLAVQQVLVVTFTNAATAELRERIRSRIVEALAHLRGTAHEGEDPFVPTLLAAVRARSETGDDDDALRTRLELALQTFDEASIFTIHGFCQRALADAPFAAQLPLAVEALADDGELIAEAAKDFWRRNLSAAGALAAPLAAQLAARKDQPERLARLLQRHLAKPLATQLWPRALDGVGAPALDVAPLQAAHDAARALWQAEREAIVNCLLGSLDQLNAGTFKPEAIGAAAQGWDSLLAGSDALSATKDKLELFARGKQAEKTKKGCTAPGHPFFDLAQALLDLRRDAEQVLALQRLALLRRMLDEGSAAVREAKHRQRVVAFDDMLFNLYQRLVGAGANGLAEALRARFPAALIDEFQDTDPLQFAIFDAIYGGTPLPLLLVGDPKQAIYSFRNADLPTYLHARDRARATYALAANQRSSGVLIAALNALFGANRDAFMQPGLAYHPVVLGDKPRPALHDATEARAALQVWLLPDAPRFVKQDAAAAAVAATAAEIARLIAAGQRGEIRIGDRALGAGDIAVLVRSHAQAGAVRRALAAAGVGAVELSRASVFQGNDAEELARLLAAVQSPQREGLVRAALATELLGLDATALAALADDEPAWTAHLERFARYRELWRARGIGFMLRELMFAEGLPARLLARSDGERRLTNWLHLAECLHQAAQTHGAPDALLRWFERQRQPGQAGDEATQLRLESDQNLVQIVTVHRAKGLEYGFVFCPLLWDGATAAAPRDEGDGIEYHDDAGHGVIDFRKGLDDAFDEAGIKRQRHLERAAEELRLIYVALTRAVHRCTIVAGTYERRSGRSVSVKESAASLLNWLVASAGLTPVQWLAGEGGVEGVVAAWQALVARVAEPGAIGVGPMPQAEGFDLPAAALTPEQIGALPPPRRIAPAWRIGSYSALVQGAAHEAAAADHDARAAGATAGLDDMPLARDDILRFPRGAAAGICLHALFERADFAERSSWPAAIDAALAMLPAEGEATSRERQAMLDRLLRDVLATPLPADTARPLVLGEIPAARRLVELEFHLPVRRLDATALNALLAELGAGGPRLDFATLRGFLKGYIDLVVEHAGRFFIVDWKSNHLGNRASDYAPGRVAATMSEQGYHLQALCYALALERLLRRRLRAYDSERHFGGVLYLFVRGLRPGWTDADGRPTGVHFQRPTPEVLARLSALLAGESEVAR